MLVAALEDEDDQRYERFLLAGGEPKKFKWVTESPSKRFNGNKHNDFGRGLEKFVGNLGKKVTSSKSDIKTGGQIDGAKLLAQALGKELLILLPSEKYVTLDKTFIASPDKNLHHILPVTTQEAENIFGQNFEV